MAETQWLCESIYKQETLTAFIREWRQYPILWDPTSNDYSDGYQKKRFYRALLSVYQKINKDGKIEDIKTLINKLRTTHKLELKKIKDSHGDYESKSWIFSELNFLADTETPEDELEQKQKISQLLSLACNYLSKDEKDDQVAQVWAKKLKELEPQQRLFAEKAMNDILFEAKLGRLHIDSVKINCPGNKRPPSVLSPAVLSKVPKTIPVLE